MLTLNLGTSFDAQAAKGINLLPAVFAIGALRVVTDTGNLIKLANVSSPLDKPSSVKITNTRIPNVYLTLAKGSVPTGHQAVNTSGQSIFVELNAVASKTIGDEDNEVLVPLTARVEVRVPNDGDITDDDIKALLLATLSNLCDKDGNCRVTQMMRGVLPRD